MNDIFGDDELPEVGQTHLLADISEREFETVLQKTNCFQVQFRDRKDYGTDYNLEAVLNERFATNVRVSVQLKGTEKQVNNDGSLSIQVNRTNLSYLASQPYSIYVAYHKPSDTFFVAETENVIFRYEGHGDKWRTQEFVTINFTQFFDQNYLSSLLKRVVSRNNNEKTARLSLVTATAESLVSVLDGQSSNIVIPHDVNRATELLSRLFDESRDKDISDNFDAFFAVLGDDLNARQKLYFSEINLGVEGYTVDRDRIVAAIKFLEEISERSEFGFCFYNMGNAYSVLNDVENSTRYFKLAISRLEKIGEYSTAAMAHKNLGTNYENTGHPLEAVKEYERAIELDPNLAEALFALGIKSVKEGKYQDALNHFDKISFVNRPAKHTGALQGWRIVCLFNLGDTRSAFRDVFALTSLVENKGWSWAWCAKQVHLFGFSGSENLEKSIQFWGNFVRIHPEHSLAKMQLVLCKNKLLEIKPSAFDVNEFESAVLKEWTSDDVDIDNAALIFDRLGHRHQKSLDWPKALQFFELANEIDSESYSCCLATAYNHLRRYDDALVALIPHEEFYLIDDIYWFQRATAYSYLHDYKNAIDAYKKAIQINDDYELAWYNLAGNYFNDKQFENAKEAFEIALSKFPESDLASEANNIIILMG